MPIQVKIEVNDDEVQKMLEKMRQIPAKTLKFFAKTAAPYMRESFKKNFEAEGRPIHWQRLSSATAKYREIGRARGWWGVGDYFPVLRRTGELMKMVISTEEDVSLDSSEATMEMDPQKMVNKFSHSEQGGAHSYIEHQLGINVKQRQMVLFQSEDIEWLSNRYQDFINESVKI